MSGRPTAALAMDGVWHRRAVTHAQRGARRAPALHVSPFCRLRDARSVAGHPGALGARIRDCLQAVARYGPGGQARARHCWGV